MTLKNIFKFFMLAVCLIVNMVFLPISKTQYYCDTQYFEQGSGNYTYHNEIIDFDTDEVTDYHLERLCPLYSNITQLNSCAPMAGCIVMGYYDYEFENLIPDFTACYYYNNTFRYRPQTAKVITVKEELYTLMGTNSINPGTSVSQFKKGMTAYVNSKDLSIQYNRCYTIQNMINYFEQSQPIVLFLNSYDYYDASGMSRSENQLCLYGKTSTNGHVVVAYGYKQYKFYTNNVLTRTENFLVISFGDSSTGFLSVNSLRCIDEAYAIKIS